MERRLAEKIYEISLLFIRIVLMNIYWIIFVITGLGIFGFLPATITLVQVYRKSFTSENDFSWSKEVWRNYFMNFRKFYFLSLTFSLVMLSIFISRVLWINHSIVIERIGLFFLIYVLLLVIPYLSVNEVHLSTSKRSLLKNAFLLPLFWGITSLKILGIFFLMIILCYLVPGLIPILSISLPLYIITYLLLTEWGKQLERSF